MSSSRRSGGVSVAPDNLTDTATPSSAPDYLSRLTEFLRQLFGTEAGSGDLVLTAHLHEAADALSGLPGKSAQTPDLSDIALLHVSHVLIADGSSHPQSLALAKTLDDHALPGSLDSAATVHNGDASAPIFAGASVFAESQTGQNLPAQSSSTANFTLGPPSQSSAEQTSSGSIEFFHAFTKDFGLPAPADPELWISATQGGSENLIIHADDTGSGVASNTGTLFTPISANNPTTGTVAPQIELLVLDTQDNAYFVASVSGGGPIVNQIYEGSLSAVLANPTATPTLTPLYNSTSGGGLTGLAVDPDNSALYFDQGMSFERLGYGGGSPVVLGTAPVFLDGMALDLPAHVAYFVSGTSNTTSTTTFVGGTHVHYITTVTSSIYKTSNLTPSSGSGSITFTKLIDIVPATYGSIWDGVGEPGITVDTTTGLIYFTMHHVNGVGGTGGVYSLDPNTDIITAIWTQGSGGGPTGDLEYISVDHATGKYYVTVANPGGAEGGAIYVGSLTANGSTPPTLFLTMPTYNSGTVAPNPNGFSVDNAPTLSGIAGTASYALQGGSALAVLSAAGTDADTDNTKGDGASIVITNAQSGDQLFVNGQQSGTLDGGKVSVTWNSSTHTLTLFGTDSFAEYQTLLGEVSFQDTGTDNSTGSHPVRTIDFSVYDGLLYSPVQAVSLNIDRAPTLVADSYSVLESASSSGTSGTGGTGVLGNDSDKDGDSLVLTAVNGSGGNVGSPVAGTYGHLTLNSNGSYTYNADNTSAIDSAPNGSHPVDTYTYTVSDGVGGVTTTTVSFTIDRAPTVVADSGAAVESGSAGTGNVLTNDSDKDGDSLTVSAVNGSGGNVGGSVLGTYGHMTINSNGSYSYTADNTSAIDSAATGSHLTDTFTYTASDGHGGTTTTNIVITLDRAPTDVSDANAALESGAAATGNVLTNDSDRDGDTLTVSAVNGSGGNVGNSLAGTYGHLTLNSGGSYSYTADNTSAIDGAATGSHLTDTFSYTANDGHGATTTTNLVITIDRAPVGVADTATIFAGATATATSGTGVLSNDTDRDGDTLTVSAITGGTVGTSLAGTYGELTLNSDGSYSYVADNTTNINSQADNAVLTDQFTYTLSDGHGGTSTATLTFTVDQAPTVTSFDAVATSGADFTASHTVTFTLDTGKNVTVAGGTTLALSDGGTATYVSGSGTQTIVFSYSATDAPGALSVSSISAGSIADAAGNPLILAGTAVGTYTDTVSDTAANVSTFLDSLQSHHADIVSVTLTDGGTPELDLTVNQYFNDTDATALIVSSYDPVILDTAAHIQTALDTLETSVTGNPASIGNVEFTDAGTPTLTLTAAQYASDSDIINLFSGTYAIIVTGSGTTLESGFSGTPPTYTQFEVFNGSQNYTVYSNTDGSQTFVYQDGATIDDSASTHNDFFDLSQDSGYDITGGSGNDAFYFAGNLDSSDHVNGGGGTNNQIGLEGDYSSGFTLQGSNISNIQVIACLPGSDYTLTAASDLLTSGQSMTIWATHLAAANTLVFDGSQVVSGGSFTVFGGAGNDTITGGSGADNIYGQGGADTLTGGGGADHFVYSGVSDSTSTTYDTITDFDASADRFDLPGSVTGIDATIASGTLDSGGSFDTELAAAVNAAALGIHHAVLFTPDSGTLSGHTFLIVDANGSAGYQTGADYVFDITGATNLGSLATGDFI